MKKQCHIIGAILISLSLQLSAGNCPGLSGNFTIGKEQNADFNTLSDAANALKCGGLSGPVTFIIENGVYNEKIVMSTFEGASAINTIKFQSKSGTNSDVIISYGSSDATLVMNGTSFVSFENITIDHKASTYGNCVRIDGKAAHLQFYGVALHGVETETRNPENAVVYASSNAPKTDISFRDCEIENGSMGIYKSGVNPESPDTRTLISGNLFMNQYESALSLSHEDAPEISNNVVSSILGNAAYKAINLNNVSNRIVLNQNIINASSGSSGLFMNGCVAAISDPGQITNNSISLGASQQGYGIWLSGVSDNQVLNFNRVKLGMHANPNPDQGYFRNSSTGNNINILNNIFYDMNGGGYTIIGNTYKDYFNQLPAQSNPSLATALNGIMIEKVSIIK